MSDRFFVVIIDGIEKRCHQATPLADGRLAYTFCREDLVRVALPASWKPVSNGYWRSLPSQSKIYRNRLRPAHNGRFT